MNFTKWFKEGIEMPEGANTIVDAVTDIFKKNESIVEKGAVSVKFKNGAHLVIRIATEAVDKITKTKKSA